MSFDTEYILTYYKITPTVVFIQCGQQVRSDFNERNPCPER